MATAKTNMLRVTLETKTLFDSQKKGLSADEYLKQMLNYFIVTNIDPGAWKNNPTDGILKAIVQVKEMIRAIERDKINVILSTVKSQNTSIHSTDTAVTAEELKLIIDTNTELNDTILSLENQVEKLRLENEKLKITHSDPQEKAINITVIKQSISGILENAKSNRLKDGEVLIPRSVLEGFLGRIKAEIEK